MEKQKVDLKYILDIYGQSSKLSTNPDCGKIYLIGIDEENKGENYAVS